MARAETFKRVNAVRRAKASLCLLCNTEQIQFAVLSDQGQSCQEACMTRHSTCDLMELNRRNEEQMIDILKRELEIKCMMDDRTWWSFDQPSVVVDPLDKNFGRCLGWKGKPKYHDCSARWPTVRRLSRQEMDQIISPSISSHLRSFYANCSFNILWISTCDL
ncbi:conserved hypothetical protein [Trichinella spiralis]|uniref:hypothetical protein n=1 Tax=Trichinella spiralis TaxID=6334 RepID=UPI0001EFBE58|nr:conserved hypothetical protein [Trichinella spiralis]